jgi:hypothetical protein
MQAQEAPWMAADAAEEADGAEDGGVPRHRKKYYWYWSGSTDTRRRTRLPGSRFMTVV